MMLLNALPRQMKWTIIPVTSAVDQVGGADGGGEDARVAGARVHVGCGVGELDHVLVAMLDGPGERLLRRLWPARRVWQRGRVGGGGGGVDGGQRCGGGPGRGRAWRPQLLVQRGKRAQDRVGSGGR